jgi:hypothetical protein
MVILELIPIESAKPFVVLYLLLTLVVLVFSNEYDMQKR